MPRVVIRENESLDEGLRKFKRSMSKAGTLQDLRRHEFYVKKGLRRKLKSEEARRKKFK